MSAELSDESLKVLHANQISYASLNGSNSEGLTAALALRYVQTAAFNKLNPPAQAPLTCSACAVLWIPGLTCQVRIAQRKKSTGILKKTTNLSSRARKRKALRASARQEKLKVKLEADKNTLSKKNVLQSEGLSKSQIVYKCLVCLHALSQDVPEAERQAVHLPFSSRPKSSPDVEMLDASPDTSVKKKRPKSKKGSSLSKLVAKKQEQSKASSLGLADFLAK